MWLRTGLMLRWLVPTTYILAVAMLVLGNLGLRVTLLFPPVGSRHQHLRPDQTERRGRD